MKRRVIEEQLAVIDELRQTIARQQQEIDQLTRTMAAWKLIVRAYIGRGRTETR